MVSFQKRRLFNLMIGIAVAALLTVMPPAAWGQSPSPAASPSVSFTPKLDLPNPIATLGSSDTTIVTGDVRLDGRKLFTIATPAVNPQPNQSNETLPVQERVEKIETTLNTLVKEGFDPKNVSVVYTIDSQSGQPVVTVNDRYLMTVTSLDAQIQGQEVERWAQELTQTIKKALLQAHQERQSDYLVRQALLAGQILLGVAIASWVIAGIQRRLKRQQELLKSLATEEAEILPDPRRTTDGPALASVRVRMDERQQRNLKDVQRRLLQLAQIVIWSSSIFAVLGLFYFSRRLQPLIFSTPLKVLGTLLITYVVIRISSVLIDRFFGSVVVQDFISPDRSQRLALRVSTFSRVLTNVIAAFCMIVALLSILSTLGVNLAPVLAGAGILGLAVSFASQNLIKDMINGLLILSEDQYAVGDVIQIDKVSGLVEYMSLRITQLRNAEGRLITIPNGTISVVENLSKDWSRVDLAVTIAYDADVDLALELIQQVGAAMSRDPDWQSKIPEPPEVLGVDEFSNAGITIRIWIKTAPLEQWKVAREFRRRLKLALDRAGIAIGVPQQSLWFRRAGTPFDPEKVLNGESERPDKAANP